MTRADGRRDGRDYVGGTIRQYKMPYGRCSGPRTLFIRFILQPRQRHRIIALCRTTANIIETELAVDRMSECR